MDDLNINSFNALYTLYYRKSFLFAKSYVHDEQVAEDIAAEALIKLWEKLKTDIINSPQAMLLTILKNKSLDYLRLEQNKLNAMSELSELYVRELDIRVSSLEACDPSEIFSEEVNQIIQATLRTLPEQTRRVFKMSRFENKMNKEIAENLGITVKGVEYHISRALKEFRISLKDYLPLFYFFSISTKKKSRNRLGLYSLLSSYRCNGAKKRSSRTRINYESRDTKQISYRRCQCGREANGSPMAGYRSTTYAWYLALRKLHDITLWQEKPAATVDKKKRLTLPYIREFIKIAAIFLS